MGYMTEIAFLNDNWSSLKREILDDPQKFVDAIQEAMNGVPMYGPEDDLGKREYLGHETPAKIRLGLNAQLTMYESHHADQPRLYLAHRNMFLSLNPYDFEKEYGKRIDSPDDHLLGVLDQFVGVAEGMIHRAAQFIREKYEAREAGVGS